MFGPEIGEHACYYVGINKRGVRVEQSLLLEDVKRVLPAIPLRHGRRSIHHGHVIRILVERVITECK